MWSNKKVRIVVIIALGISLFSGVSIVAVKSVTYLQVERKKQKRVESLKEASRQVKAWQKIALWVVQHYDGQKTIKTIEVGKIYTYGILASGGRSVSVIINVMILGLNNL